MNRGTLIWAPFPFSNFEVMKARPACVVSAAAYNEGPDLVLAMVTSSARRLERPELGDVVLVDWQEAGLRFPSVLRAGRLRVLERRLIVADHLGQLTGRDLLAVDAALRSDVAEVWGPCWLEVAMEYGRIKVDTVWPMDRPALGVNRNFGEEVGIVERREDAPLVPTSQELEFPDQPVIEGEPHDMSARNLNGRNMRESVFGLHGSGSIVPGA